MNMASLNASPSFKILPSLAHTTNKAGIIAMTRQLAMEGREHGIRAASAGPRRSRTSRCSWLQTRAHTSPGSTLSSMVG